MNADLLRNRIKESGLKYGFIAEKCGLTYPGLLNKLNGVREFKLTEANTIKNLLKISDEEFCEIFFDHEVDKMPT